MKELDRNAKKAGLVASQLERLKSLGLKVTNIELDGINFLFANEKEFWKIYQDIFKRQIYHFDSNNESPRILDCGSHIGVSVLYFKSLYPNAVITAFEPNPKTFQMLRLNVLQNGLSDVRLINKALANNEKTSILNVSSVKDRPWTWDDSCAQDKWNDPKLSETILVETERLSPYLLGQVDLLKLDVEGKEGEVLLEASAKLRQVRNIIVEFHGMSSNSHNRESDLFSILEMNSFSYSIEQDKKVVTREEIVYADPYWLFIRAWKS